MSSSLPARASGSGTITSEILTIDRIDISPLNVRRHRATINAIAAMEASILGHGLIQPLNVHPMKGSRKFGAFAGGRRCRAIRNLVERGDLPADFEVPAQIYHGFSDVEIIEISLGENIQRSDLQLYEICAGIRALDKREEPIEAIARGVGQPLAIVRRWHRVGQLAEPIFTAFAEERISAEEAKAYAATTDQALQLAVFGQLAKLPIEHRTPERIRAAMKIGDRQTARLLRLVGDEAYRAAGGRFELDLFADSAEQRGRIVDEGKLQELANARLDEVRAATRAEVARDVRFLPAPPKNSGGYTDYNLQVTPKKRPGGGLALPDGGIVATIELSEAGEPQVTYWWESRKEKFGNARAAAPAGRAPAQIGQSAALVDPYHSAAPARAALKDEHGISADALEAMKSVRRELLRALIVEDAQRGGVMGRDFALWAQLRALLSRDSSAGIGARAPAIGAHAINVPFIAMKAAEAQVEHQQANIVWEEAVREVTQARWIAEPDLAVAFRAFVDASGAEKALAGAVLAGLTLERGVNAPGFRLPAQDALAQLVRGDHAPTVRRLWSPLAEFLELLPKGQLLALAEPLIGPETFARWGKLKAAELPGLLAQALAGEGSAVAARNRPVAAAWIHPLLAFGDTAEADAPLAEAAE